MTDNIKKFLEEASKNQKSTLNADKVVEKRQIQKKIYGVLQRDC